MSKNINGKAKECRNFVGMSFLSLETSGKGAQHDLVGTNQNDIQYPWTGEGYQPGKSYTFFVPIIGTHGDIRSLAKICKRLQADGHKVRIATHEDHRKQVESHGFEMLTTEGFPPNPLVAAPPDGTLTGLLFDLLPNIPNWVLWYDQMCQTGWSRMNEPWADGSPFEPDAILSTFHNFQPSIQWAEATGLPLFVNAMHPSLPTDAVPGPLHMFELPMMSNSFDWWIEETALNLMAYLFGFGNKCRQHLELRLEGALDKQSFSGARKAILRVPTFAAWSPSLLPNLEEWHENHVVTGYITDTVPGASLPNDLEEYLAAGEPPIFVGFGSMTSKTLLRNVWTSVMPACQELNITRAVFQVNDISNEMVSASTPPGVFVFNGKIPHELLFPRVTGIVSHGGPGTIQAGLAAGIPTCVLSFFLDQPMWGNVMTDRRLGAHVPATHVTPSNVAECMTAIQDPEILSNAKVVAEQMANEPDPVEAAVQVIYSRMPSGPVNYQELESRVDSLQPPNDRIIVFGFTMFFTVMLILLTKLMMSRHRRLSVSS